MTRGKPLEGLKWDPSSSCFYCCAGTGLESQGWNLWGRTDWRWLHQSGQKVTVTWTSAGTDMTLCNQGLRRVWCPTRWPHGLSVTPWTAAHQAPLFMGFSRQESWSGLPCPPPGDLPYPEIKPGSPALQAVSLLSEAPEWLEKRICWWTGSKRWAVEVSSFTENQTSYREVSLALGFPYLLLCYDLPLVSPWTAMGWNSCLLLFLSCKLLKKRDLLSYFLKVYFLSL